jgi:hypothetical protein
MPSNTNRPDYPALYDSANNASLTSQKYYMLGMKWYIGLSIAAAFLSIYIKESTFAGILATIMFFAIMFLTIFQAVKRYDRTWYNGRAVAESVKTRTWRFITRAEPYFNNENVNNVREEFCNDLKDILDQNRELGSFLSHESVTKNTITQYMLEIRKFSLTDRLNYYVSNRINEQRNWYHTKASYNKAMAKKWFIGLIVINSIIILLLLIEVGYDIYNLPTPALIVVGSSIVSWTQIKKYQDLATSYGLTAHEIGIIKDQSFKVQGEKELSDFVKDAENAFSREHTQWVARKDKP